MNNGSLPRQKIFFKKRINQSSTSTTILSTSVSSESSISSSNLENQLKNQIDITTNIHITESFSKQKLQSILDEYHVYYTPTMTTDDLKVLCKMKIYNLNMPNELLKIQQRIRAEYKIFNFMIYTYLKILGNGYDSLKSCCLNEEDIGTGDLITEIPNVYLLIDEDHGYYYGFDIRTLITYEQKQIEKLNLSKNSNNDNMILINPFTKKFFSNSFISTYLKKYDFLRRNGWNMNYRMSVLNNEQKQRIQIIDLFQKINQLGFYVKSEWFINLSYKKCIKLYLGMDKILTTLSRSMVNRVVKSKIFKQGHTIYKIYDDETSENKELVIKSLFIDLNKLFTEGNTTSDRINGVLWFLTVFIQVSNEAYEHLSYLFQ